MRAYKLITYADRQKIEQLLQEGKNFTEIAAVIGVHRATIYRELKRGCIDSTNNTSRLAYSAEVAQRNVR